LAPDDARKPFTLLQLIKAVLESAYYRTGQITDQPRPIGVVFVFAERLPDESERF
jgi:hypothetical protein